MPNVDLRSVQYREWTGLPREWSIDGLVLGPINLVVGKNATGKSRTLNIIGNLAKTLLQDTLRVSHGNYDVAFSVDDMSMRYVLNFDDNKVIEEALYIDGVPKLTRNESMLELFYEKEGKNITHEPSSNEVSAAARKDKQQHPALMLLNDWARSVRHYKFGEKLGQQAFSMGVKSDPEQRAKFRELFDSDPEKVVAIFQRGKEEFGNEFVEAIVEDMRTLGFSMSSIDATTPPGFQMVIHTPNDQDVPVQLPGEVRAISITEDGVQGTIDQVQLSQGMFRALSILIQVTYSQLSHRAHCIIVDDIGEGLDFERSSGLIELLRKKAKAASFQLIMSTNDRFVMNHVPLDEWSILQRTGSRVSVRNIHNSKAAFEDFRFIGMSNFAFFEMDFVNGAPREDRTLHLEGMNDHE